MKKRGFTLVELISVIAVLAVVLGVAVVMFGQLFDFQRDNDEYTQGIRSVNRLAADFRTDVRTYGMPDILSEGETLLRWTTESETVEYTLQSGGFPEQQNVIRTVREENKQTRYETYRLPERTALHFTEGQGENAGVAALSLWIAPPGTEIPKLDELNPFDRTVPQSLERHVNPKYAGNWRTIVVRY